MDAKLLKKFQEQVNFEAYSGYLYLSMSAWAELNNWHGFANWLNIQAQEEAAHSKVLYDFLLERSQKPALAAIAAPPSDWADFEEIFTQTLSHEREVTRRIQELTDLAVEVKDHAAYDLLALFIKEQVEEENNAEELLISIQRIKSAPAALYMLDGQLKSRVYSFPFPTLLSGN